MYVNGVALNNPAVAVQSTPAKADGAAYFGNILSDAMSGTANLDAIFEQASEKYDVPINLLKAVAKAESNFSPKATSGCGAMGIMQLMPDTAKSLGVSDPYDPEQNIIGGAKYLSNLLSEFGGNEELAVAAYNAGPGSVLKYNGIPPFSETQSYVSRVMGYCGENISAGSVQNERNAYQNNGEVVSSDRTKNDDLYALLQMGFYQMQMQLFEDTENGLLPNDHTNI